MVSKRTGDVQRIRIKRVHLEEDTGKLIHEGDDTLVDFNRAGVPLCEIVTEPDFHNSEDVKQFLEELQVLVRYLGISEADMEKGSMRLEPNISLKKPGHEEVPDYKVEVKNINSFNFAKRAIDFELKRHEELLEQGVTPVQETRGYKEADGSTISQRVKEEAADYRYMPEPDIPPFQFDDDFIAEIRSMMPELPQMRIERYVSLGVYESDAYILTRSLRQSKYFDALCDAYENPAEITSRGRSIASEIARLLVNKIITSDLSQEEAKNKLSAILYPAETDTLVLDEAIQKVISENEDAVNLLKGGKDSTLMFLVGQVMKEMKGQANAALVTERLRTALDLKS
jgi:aspartyl-tRNA(Asn)/glutamyl-tRNA(Gln) amidotransferase subunit B